MKLMHVLHWQVKHNCIVNVVPSLLFVKKMLAMELYHACVVKIIASNVSGFILCVLVVVLKM